MTAMPNPRDSRLTAPAAPPYQELVGRRGGEDRRNAAATEESWLVRAKEIIEHEASAVRSLVGLLDHQFTQAVEMLLECRGKVVVTGIGKAGIVGQKFAASLSSTGTPSHFLHPAEAVHGDLGCVQPSDVIVVLSYSGETAEVNRLLPYLQRATSGIVAITATGHSTLSRAANATICLGSHAEAGRLGLAPTTSTMLMLAICDALALIVSERREFTEQQFAVFHPAGSLGRRLAPVLDVMRPLDQCRVATQDKTVREVLVSVSRPGRRTGCIMIVDSARHLVGLFTDSDLARLLERAGDLDQPITTVMTHRFLTIDHRAGMPEAVAIMREKKISELPVVDAEGCPVGLLDITDLVGLLAEESAAEDIDQPPAIIYPIAQSRRRR
ncbi:MAG: hypothetical protein KatS3mg111_3911 [Pirellulaceae bacterium]|nr:MAG: hypothetical protein KatS3mg111_3911 [Pirellulaceae bacterium]